MTRDETASASRYDIAAYLISGAGLFFIMRLHLLPALIAGLLVHELVRVLASGLRATRLGYVRARVVAVALLAAIIVTLLVLSIWGAIAFFIRSGESIPALLDKMAEIIDRAQGHFPSWISDYLPAGPEGVRTGITGWLRAHAGSLKIAGKAASRVAAYTFIGMVLGALVFLEEMRPGHRYLPLAQALAARMSRLAGAFRSIIFAQVRIAALNTIFAGLYLGVILPLAGVHLPLVKTMVALTFVTGMLPVVGNLISNTVVVVVSLSYSPAVAVGSLVFLVVIHKLEYFLNARIVSTQIQAHAWEVLIAMLVMDAAFGLPGVIAAPIYYAYIKRELSDTGIV